MPGVIIAAALAAAALALVGPRRCISILGEYARALRGAWGIVATTLVLAAVLPLIGRFYVDVRAFAVYTAASSVAFISLLLLATRFDGLRARIVAVVRGYPVALVAALALVAGVVAGRVVLGDVPHVSDEVAYQFQARTMALGRLALDAPRLPAFFDITHTMVDGGKWFGIMNPGWPAILAAGYAAHLAWLVNPLLAALTLVLFYRFFTGAGYTPLQTRIAVLILAISPFALWMSGTYMAHTANLFLFALFAWSWVRMFASGGLGWGVLAGGALGLNMLVRPVDAMAVALPFGIQLLVRAARERRWIAHLAVVGVVAGGIAALTLLYNRALMGSPLTMPMTEYFVRRNPHERFGIGFGPNMGTKMHGDEWPGYYPSDAPRVSSYRLVQLLQDVLGLPLLLLGAIVFTAWHRPRRWSEWHLVLVGSALSLFAVYLLHFYHGIAYGSRHYFLALPALAMMIALPLGRWMEGGSAPVARLAASALAALLLHVAIFPYPALAREYGDWYRGASSAVRDAVAARGLDDALVFVSGENWGWKSAFPLNEYPLERNRVLFAKDRGAENAALAAQFPKRATYALRIGRGRRVEIRPLALPPAPVPGGVVATPDVEAR
ncbi:MAG TPA: hypothetical protein VFS05_12510 [Gemmatimonadaceae bacterium]|nr:hypothetical protein [Gemmatimonadaceae bacterium]